jgi:hypothetical protein
MKSKIHEYQNKYLMMSKNVITVLITLFISIACFAQQGINYKAIIKDGNGNILPSQDIEVRFFILKNGGALVYNEDHLTTTGVNGLVVLTIGEGDPGQLQVFNDIDWEAEIYDLRVGVDLELDGTFVYFNDTPFKAVPYAKYAERAATADHVIVKINDLTDGKSDAAGSSIFLGENAGLLDDETDNHNIGIGINALNSNTSGSLNIATGSSALGSNTSGAANIAIGYEALRFNTTASSNTATGFFALRNNTTGYSNVATGSTALYLNTIGYENTATGTSALSRNTEGYQNSAFGFGALQSNITGIRNTANGTEALKANTTGNNNTASGSETLTANTTGNNNTAAGSEALKANTTGSSNTANGRDALIRNTTGFSNTATGADSLIRNTVGNNNTANGRYALANNVSGDGNTASGYNALRSNSSGDNNVAIGLDCLAGTKGSNNIGMGVFAVVPSSTGSNQVRIGNTAITYAGIQVAWTITSDRRWKENIRKLPYGLQMVMQLQPVDYTRKNSDSKKREMGFIAQDLEAVVTQVGYTDQGFLTKDDDGYLSVRYNDFIPLLTKAIQEQQDILDTQSIKLNTLENQMSALSKRMESLENINK